MCYGCYKEFGNPVQLTDKVIDAVSMIEIIYHHSMVGGNLHIVLDDWNIEDDDSIQWCLNNSIKENSHQLELYVVAIEKILAELFLTMTVAERATAIAEYCGFIDHGPYVGNFGSSNP